MSYSYLSVHRSGPGTTPIRNSSGTSGWGGFGGFGGGGMDQAKMEMAVAAASRSFGEGVQNIVVSAKARQAGKGDGEWKQALLALLGQGPPVASSAASGSPDRRGVFDYRNPRNHDRKSRGLSCGQAKGGNQQANEQPLSPSDESVL